MNRRQAAIDLFQSVRGHYIIGQALYKAIEVMKKEKFPEDSNIYDMQLMMDEIFPMFKVIKGGA